MFGNESHSEAMEEFLNLLGDRVKLKDFKQCDKLPILLLIMCNFDQFFALFSYKAGLDTNSDMTGKESVYTTFQGK